MCKRYICCFLHMCRFLLSIKKYWINMQHILVDDKSKISFDLSQWMKKGFKMFYINTFYVWLSNITYMYVKRTLQSSKLWSYTSDLFGNHLCWVTTYILSIFLFLACLGPDCKMHSLNNKGPCINGGNLTCTGDEVAPTITCKCPPHYKGNFCEEKMENVIVFIHFNFFFLVHLF